MATTVDWGNKIINVLRADMLIVQVSPEIRQLDLDTFRLDLKALEAGVEGMSFLDTHSHNTTVTVGGVTLARVIEIINGYTVTFEDGKYAVNLVGANSNVADVTNVNQVSVRSANSAGLTYSDAINKQSFQGGFVYVDTNVGLPGTQFPRGTPSDPVGNWPDASGIAAKNSYDNYHLDGQLTLPSGSDLKAEVWQGESALHTDMEFLDNNLSGTTFNQMSLGGIMSDGPIFAKECLIRGLTGFKGSLKECQMSCHTVIHSGFTDIAALLFCASNVPGTGAPVLDFNSAACDGEIRFYAGGMIIRNFNQGKNLSIDMIAGHIYLEDSCTSGTVVIRGNAKVTDLTTGAGITVNTDHVVNSQVEAVKRDTSLIPATL